MKQIVALVDKDIRLHGRAIAGVQAALLALFVTAGLVHPGASIPSILGLLFNVNLFAALFWGEWIVSREKTKGTVAWLRTLPLSDRTLLGSKIAMELSCCTSMWVLSSALVARTYFFPSRLAAWFVMLLAVASVGILSLCCRLVFRQKLGQLLPLALIGVPLLLVTRVMRADGNRLLALWSTDIGKAVMAGGLCLSCVLLFGITSAWLRHAETPAILE